MYLLFISWKSGEHSHYPIANWLQLQSKLAEMGLTPSALPEGHGFETGYHMEADSTWYSWTEVNPREVFMDLYRNSDTLNDCMSTDDCTEVFSGICKGGQDITVDLLNNVLSDYETDLRVVDVRTMDAELDSIDGKAYFWSDGVRYRVLANTENDMVNLMRGKEVLVGGSYRGHGGTLRELGRKMLERYLEANSSLESLLGH